MANNEAKNRAKRSPDSIIEEYRITTEEIERFIAAKAFHYKEGLKIKLAPELWERKGNQGNGRKYAMLKLTLSDAALEQFGQETSIVRQMIAENSNVRFVTEVWEAIIKKYSFNRQQLESIRKSYKTMDRLEDTLGINEDNLKRLIAFSQPRMVNVGNEKWIILAIRPEAVIEDMLSDINSGKINGQIEIVNITSITKDNVEYQIHLHTGEDTSSPVNPELIKMLHNA